MKYALLLTQACNLACRYCYIIKHKHSISTENARKAVDFIFSNSQEGEPIDIGYFGGEPLLEFNRLKEITEMIEKHPLFPLREVVLQVITNGTIFSDEMAGYLLQHNISLGVSCDGIPAVQDQARIYPDGRPSSSAVEENIRIAIGYFPQIMVNAVYTPSTYKFLPESVEYLYNLGVRKIYINPDFSARWTADDIVQLQDIFNTIAWKYIHWHETGDPAFVSLINGKLAVILDGGYKINERCHMGKKEFAIAPNGNIFPCERLVGDGSLNEHCIGNIHEGVDYRKFCTSRHFEKPAHTICSDCSLRRYCMNWCGCSNFFSTGHYNQAGPFICASEKAAINTALAVFKELETKFGTSTLLKIAGNTCAKEKIPALNTE